MTHNMHNFDYMWDNFPVGTRITVRSGKPEPDKNDENEIHAWRRWKCENLDGWISAKQDGSPRVVFINTGNGETGLPENKLQYDYYMPTLDEHKQVRLDALSNYRWERTQEYSYDGVTDIAADVNYRNVSAKLNALSLRTALPTNITKWKLGKREFRTWNTSQLQDYAKALDTFLQACYDNEERLANDIRNAPTLEALFLIDIASGWPQ